jgi:hypothetical protein
VSALIPDGYFVDDHLVWGDLGRGGILSRGYRFQFPDNSASDDDAFIELEDNIRKILASCQRDERLQLLFYTSSDYEGPLGRYQEQTKNAKSPRTIAIREELTRNMVELPGRLAGIFFMPQLEQVDSPSGERRP